MFPYHRLDEIFDYIRKNDYIAPARLASIFKITERTIRNDIQEINTILAQHGAVIKLKRKHGYYIEISDHNHYEQFLHKIHKESLHMIELDSSKDRIKYICNLLLSSEDYIDLEDLMDEVCISKNTLNNYIKTIKEMIRDYDLEYISKANAGIKIIGTEEAKRKCMIEHILSSDLENHITGFTKGEYKIFHEINLDELKDLTLSHLNKNKIKTSDLDLRNLTIHIALMISRIKENHYINIASIKTDESVMNLIEKMCEELEHNYDIAISNGEKLYLYLHMISNSHIEIPDIDDQQLQKNIQDMLEIIYESYRFDLRNDTILLADLFRHLKSIFASKTYALNSRNPLLETIKNNYPLAFEVTLTSVTSVFHQEPFILNESDVGYVALHIGAAIERRFAKTLQKKNVILVCGSGQATSRMLETQLTLYFPDKIEIIRCCSYNEFLSYSKSDHNGIDFVISTVPIKSKWIPSIVVNFPLTNQDIEIISQFLTSPSTKRISQTECFFDENLFFRLPKTTNKDELIYLLYSHMHAQNIVNESFFHSVIQREKLGDTNMNDIFALPHPMELCANSTKVAVALLDEPVIWNGNDTVQIIFLLAIKQGVQKDIEHLYDIFISMINDTKLQQKILQATDFSEFMTIISNI
jgi:lichenan operon transcriptional antiterminator